MPAALLPHERTFAYDGFEVAVRADRPSLVAWLEEFLSPWLAARPGPAGSGAPRVEVGIDATQLSARLAAAEPTGRAVDVFTRDQGSAPWPLVRESAGELAADPRGQLALSVAQDAREARVVRVLAAAERPYARLAAMRMVRELASAHALACGALPIHGAALAEPAGVTLFAGPKQAGKSTLLLHALLGGGARYVSNDRVFVTLDAHGAAVRGMPTIVSLRAGTLALSQRLGDALASKAWHYASTVAEARAHARSGEVAEGAGERWPPGLSPSQLCVLLGVEAEAGGRLARIVFPAVAREPEAPRFALCRLAPDEAAERLLAGGLVAGGRAAPFATGAAPPDPGALADAVRALSARVPCFACTLGAGAYALPSVWDAIREAEP